MHSDYSLHVTWDELARALAERAQLEAQLLAGFSPKPWRVPVEEQQDQPVDWCASP